MSLGDLFAKRWFQLALGAVVMAVIGAVIGLIVSPGDSGTSLGDRVIITTGSGSIITEELPLTATEATSAGWTDLVRCYKGKGRYFEKTDAQGQPGTYMLMYNNDNELIGVYIVSTVEMVIPPWERMEEGLIGVTSYEFPHWSLPVYFKDPTLACGPAVAGGSGYGG